MGYSTKEYGLVSKMEFVKYIEISHGNHKHYSYKSASNIEMCILGQFLFSDVRSDISFYREWFLDNKYNSASGNIIELYRKSGYVILKDMYSEEKIPTELKIDCSQFLQLLDDWEQKIIKQKPKEVIIKHENGEFIFETMN